MSLNRSNVETQTWDFSNCSNSATVEFPTHGSGAVGADGVKSPFCRAVKNAAGFVGDAIDKGRKAIDEGRKPGMPLSILSNIAREAPLGSLLVAFLLGVAVARRW